MGIAAAIKEITQDIAISYDLRVAEVGRLKEEAKEMLTSFQASHQEMGSRLRRALADDKAKMAAGVRAMLNGFQTSHREMGSKLKKDLAQGMAARESDVKSMLNDFQRSRHQTSLQLRKELADYDQEIEDEVAGMRQETIADLREARTAWQKLTHGVKKAAVKATPKAVRAEVEKAALKQEGTPDLEVELLAAIKEHPEGITLTVVAESLGVAPIVLGRAARKLVDEGRVRKEDKAYFPAPAE